MMQVMLNFFPWRVGVILNNLWQSLLEERKKKLRATETKVTLCDGSVFVENRNESGERVLTKQEIKSSGFVVDTKPDLQVILLKTHWYGCVEFMLLSGWLRASKFARRISGRGC
jgi:hypothetical protein